MIRPRPRSTRYPYTTLVRSWQGQERLGRLVRRPEESHPGSDRRDQKGERPGGGEGGQGATERLQRVPRRFPQVTFSAESPPRVAVALSVARSEDRRVGDECRSRWSADD